MNSPSIVRVLVSSACVFQLAATSGIALANPDDSTAGGSSTADISNREPASTETEEAINLDPTKEQQEAVLDSAYKKTAEQAKSYKNLGEFLDDWKSRLNEKDKKYLDDTLGSAKIGATFKVTYANKKLNVKFEGGLTLTVAWSDIDSYKAKIDDVEVNLDPSLSLQERMKSIDAILQKKVKSASVFDLFEGKAHAAAPACLAVIAHPGIAAGCAAVAAGIGFLTLGSHDWYNHDWLEYNYKVIDNAQATCEKYNDREVKVVHKRYVSKRRRYSYEYDRHYVEKTVEISPRELYNRKMRALRARYGVPEDGAEDQASKDKLKGMNEEAQKLWDEYQEALLTQGHQRVSKKVWRWSNAIKKQMCAGHYSLGQKLSPTNWFIDDDNDDDDDVMSFSNVCNRSKELEKCLEDLNKKGRLSETANRNLLDILDEAKIGKSFRRAEGIPIRRSHDTNQQ